MPARAMTSSTRARTSPTSPPRARKAVRKPVQHVHARAHTGPHASAQACVLAVPTKLLPREITTYVLLFARAQSIEQILQRCATTKASESGPKTSTGGAFSKATFGVGEGGEGECVADLDDPDFWSKMLGEEETTPEGTPAR